MKQFFQSIKDSIYNPSYYAELRTRPLSYSIKYFYKLAVLLALVGVILFSFTAFPNLQSFFSDAGGKIIDYYPADLEIKVEKGEVSINQPEPYELPLPEEMKGEIEREMPGVKNLVVIDTATPFSLEQFDRYATLVWLTKTHLAARDGKGQVRLNALQSLGGLTIDKTFVGNTLQKFAPVIKSIPFLILVLVFLGTLIAISGKLLYLLIAGAIVFLYFKSRKDPISYRTAYQIALHAITFPILFIFVIHLVFPQFQIPLLTTILLLLVVYMNTRITSVPATAPITSADPSSDPTPPTGL